MAITLRDTSAAAQCKGMIMCLCTSPIAPCALCGSREAPLCWAMLAPVPELSCCSPYMDVFWPKIPLWHNLGKHVLTVHSYICF